MGEMLDKAIKIAVDAHQGQLDKGGDDYILHPLRVMSKFRKEETRIVAVLHDVIEDTEVTYGFLKENGFSKEIIEALEHITRAEGESYSNFIRR